MRICANIMVKNEEAVVGRCLRSLLPHVSGFVVCDTGSEDGTKEVVEKVLGEAKAVFHLVPTEFREWDQARNDALEAARRLEPDCDYYMLVDADMELMTSPGFSFEGLKAEAYQMRQESAALVYPNVRLVKASAKAKYHGVTHEFVSVEGRTEMLEGAWFVDHANGSNRAGKFERDIRLLRTGMESDGMFLRYMFYLAQSKKDNGQFEEAMRWYATRAEAGGWDEEAWYSKYMAGECARSAGKVPEFLEWMFKACASNPRRAEPWMALVAHFRDQGWHELCSMFAARAAECRPGDGLFVDRAAHSYGPLMALSVSGFYAGGEHKEAGRKAACRLLVEPRLPEDMRWRAVQNAAHYMRMASEVFPGSMTEVREMGVAEGCWGEHNPSVAGHPAGGMEMVVRSSNYEYPKDAATRAVVLDGSGLVQTRNFYLRLDGLANVRSRRPMSTAALGKPPYDSIVAGFEDLRLFRWGGRLFATAMSKRYNAQVAHRQVLLELSEDGDVKRVVPMEHGVPGTCEKNWMPVLGTDEMTMIYRCHPFTVISVDPESGSVREVRKDEPPLNFRGWKGGSQAVPHGDGWVFVVHESVDYADRPRVYWHRLARMDKSMRLCHYTEPFCFTKVGVEYCAGLAHFNGGFLLSFGIDDRKTGMCWVSYGSMDAAWVPVGG